MPATLTVATVLGPMVLLFTWGMLAYDIYLRKKKPVVVAPSRAPADAPRLQVDVSVEAPGKGPDELLYDSTSMRIERKGHYPLPILDLSVFTELREYKPLLTPQGRAYAWAVIDYGPESHLLWVCWLRDSGECWTFSNPEIRLESNETMGIRSDVSSVSPRPEVSPPSSARRRAPRRAAAPKQRK